MAGNDSPTYIPTPKSGLVAKKSRSGDPAVSAARGERRACAYRFVIAMTSTASVA